VKRSSTTLCGHNGYLGFRYNPANAIPQPSCSASTVFLSSPAVRRYRKRQALSPGCAPSGAPAAFVLLSLDALARQNVTRRTSGTGSHRSRWVAAFEGGLRGRAVQSRPTRPLTAVEPHLHRPAGVPAGHRHRCRTPFHRPGTPILQAVSGFDAPWGAESLWCVPPTGQARRRTDVSRVRHTTLLARPTSECPT